MRSRGETIVFNKKVIIVTVSDLNARINTLFYKNNSYLLLAQPLRKACNTLRSQKPTYFAYTSLIRLRLICTAGFITTVVSHQSVSLSERFGQNTVNCSLNSFWLMRDCFDILYLPKSQPQAHCWQGDGEVNMTNTVSPVYEGFFNNQQTFVEG